MRQQLGHNDPGGYLPPLRTVHASGGADHPTSLSTVPRESPRVRGRAVAPDLLPVVGRNIAQFPPLHRAVVHSPVGLEKKEILARPATESHGETGKVSVSVGQKVPPQPLLRAP